MAAGRIVIPGMMPAEDHNGDRIPGAKLYFYENQTTILKAVYTSAALNVAHPNPVPANDVGVFPAIWAENTEPYTVVGTEADGTPLPGVNYDGITGSAAGVLASADLAEAAAVSAEASAEQAETAAGIAQGIADQFGDLESAVDAAEAAADAAEASQSLAEDAEAGAVAAQEAAEAARDQAVEIVGFDPANVVRTDIAQSFDAGEQQQARENIGAQPELQVVLREKVARPAIAAGVLTLDAAAASIFEVNWSANITGLNIINVPDDTDATTITLVLIAAGASLWTTPDAKYNPAGNVDPVLSTTTGDRNRLTFTTTDGGDSYDYYSAGFTRP